MSTEYSNLLDLVEKLKDDLAKFNLKNNRAGGTRCRKSLMAIKKLSDLMRKDILMKMNLLKKPKENNVIEVEMPVDTDDMEEKKEVIEDVKKKFKKPRKREKKNKKL